MKNFWKIIAISCLYTEIRKIFYGVANDVSVHVTKNFLFYGGWCGHTSLVIKLILRGNERSIFTPWSIFTLFFLLLLCFICSLFANFNIFILCVFFHYYLLIYICSWHIIISKMNEMSIQYISSFSFWNYNCVLIFNFKNI